MNTEIKRIDSGQLEQLAPLFNGYRLFYQQRSNPQAESDYLLERMQQDECTVFLASHDGEPAGFVLLYPTFDSVDLARVWVLHDLFVAPGFRKKGIGRSLMETAHNFCRESGASRVDLATALTNTVAQPLYESMGYERDTEFYFYSLQL
jgi:GNAT superfamily N-acetyltransferase